MTYQDLPINFQRQFGAAPSRTYFAPGRVNLIGEYTDFNGGYVLPAAIDLGTYFAARANGTRTLNVHSKSRENTESIRLEALDDYPANGTWRDFIVGTLVEFRKLGLSGEGLDIYIDADLPQSSGLSSSASLTTGLAFLLNDLWICGQNKLQLVQLAKNVENLFVGVQCGIMDQFVVAMGKTDHCVFLNCETLDFERIPLDTSGHEIIITDSRIPRKLADSAYNKRREECGAALDTLREKQDIEFLCAASVADVEGCDALRAMPDTYKRARHVASENQRVIQSRDALLRGDLERFGELMLASHISLRDDFEVSCPELDILVDAAMDIPGVLGSRMTGAGFGGCTVSLMATQAVPDYISKIHRTYDEKSDYHARIIRCHTGDGVKRLEDHDLADELEAG